MQSVFENASIFDVFVAFKHLLHFSTAHFLRFFSAWVTFVFHFCLQFYYFCIFQSEHDAAIHNIIASEVQRVHRATHILVSDTATF